MSWLFPSNNELIIAYLDAILRGNKMTELSLDHIKAAHAKLAVDVTALIALNSTVAKQVQTISDQLAAAQGNAASVAQAQLDLDALAKNMEAEAAAIEVQLPPPPVASTDPAPAPVLPPVPEPPPAPVQPA